VPVHKNSFLGLGVWSLRRFVGNWDASGCCDCEDGGEEWGGDGEGEGSVPGRHAGPRGRR
jgi:hypothetical protein